MKKYLSARFSLDTGCRSFELHPVRYGGELHGFGIIAGPVAVSIEWGDHSDDWIYDDETKDET